MGSFIDNTARVIIIVVVALIMIPAGFGLLGYTICTFAGGFDIGTRLAFVIGAAVCFGILAGGVFIIGKLSKQMQRKDQ